MTSAIHTRRTGSSRGGLMPVTAAEEPEMPRSMLPEPNAWTTSSPPSNCTH